MSRAVGPGPRKALEAPGPKALEPIGSEPKARYMRPVGPLSTNAGSILSSVRRWCYGASVSVAHSLLRTAWKSRFLFGLDLPFATAASFFCGPILGKSEYRFRSHIELALLCDETYYYAIWTDCQLEPDCRGVNLVKVYLNQFILIKK